MPTNDRTTFMTALIGAAVVGLVVELDPARFNSVTAAIAAFGVLALTLKM
ncbi:hypothetical protein OIE71_34705 (plasmid) [Streptomyces sp. NBC_01725]|nr:hypothetical protein [Streptomyces sp. NBC_01725]